MNSVFVWFLLAACSYGLSCSLGAGVKFRLLRSRRFRWTHHVLYICTFALTAAAVGTLVWTASPAGWFLLPALLPLAAVPFISARSSGHLYLALSAAPFFILGLIVSWR